MIMLHFGHPLIPLSFLWHFQPHPPAPSPEAGRGRHLAEKSFKSMRKGAGGEAAEIGKKATF